MNPQKYFDALTLTGESFQFGSVSLLALSGLDLSVEMGHGTARFAYSDVLTSLSKWDMAQQDLSIVMY